MSLTPTSPALAASQQQAVRGGESNPYLCYASRFLAGRSLQAKEAAINPDQVLVLAGNPNVGKSVVFNHLTGSYTNVSNFPGTTVDIPKGYLADNRLLKDTPGVYGLSRFSEEEQVAKQTILQADVVINVVSAATLERDLFLTQQIIDFGKPLVVVVNQIDEAQRLGIEIDLARLETFLGVPVLATIATEGKGLDDILPLAAVARCGTHTPDVPADPDALELLEDNPAQQLQVYGQRRRYINGIVREVVRHLETGQPKGWSGRLGQWLLNPFVGIVSGVACLLMLYQVVGVWVAGDVVNFTEGTLMLGGLVPLIQSVVNNLVPPHGHPLLGALNTILAGEFGVLTMSVQYIFGVLFPIILGFYIYVSLLEDCGYLPRIAVLCDSLLSKIGLNGRAVIPIVLGFGCVTMATVSTRVLTSQRERTIASTILAVTIPCSAQIAVIVGLMAKIGGLVPWLLFMASLVVVLTLLGTALNKLLPGQSSGLLLDLPPIRMPLLKNVLKKTWVRTVVFLKEAAPLFMLGSLLVSISQVTGLLVWVQGILAPITVELLNLPAQSAEVFIMGMVRRDFGAAGLYMMSEQLTSLQILTALVTITLFVPCIASATVIWKERGLVESSIVLLGSWVIAFGTGTILAKLLAAVPFI
ncbi:MAG: ferrous iron transporter B [Cyanobacteria bacterium HKST-UBA04]|nr:ferrous iron transporter B [Cyanobacteria bacterium HKST-UBA04]MCA9841847.1 ferrous iron transporter B [Cyanobacteria bacterium HKST-UBA03]